MLLLVCFSRCKCSTIGVQVSFKHSGYTVTESAGKVAITLQAARRGLHYFAAFYVKIKASVNKNLNPSGIYNLHTILNILCYTFYCYLHALDIRMQLPKHILKLNDQWHVFILQLHLMILKNQFR